MNTLIKSIVGDLNAINAMYGKISDDCFQSSIGLLRPRKKNCEFDSAEIMCNQYEYHMNPNNQEAVTIHRISFSMFNNHLDCV